MKLKTLTSVTLSLSKGDTGGRNLYAYATLFFILLLLCPLQPSHAQSPLPYAQSIVDTLTSPHFAGRGYLDDADGLTATFIAGEFQSMGLSPVFEDFLQPFPLSVDVYPYTPTLKINNVDRNPGIDYLPFPGSISGSALNHRNIVYAGAGLFLQDLNVNNYKGLNTQNAIVVIDEHIPDSIRTNKHVKPVLLTAQTRIELAYQLGARCVILLTEHSLAHSYSPSNTSVPAFIVRKQIWPNKIDELSFTLNTALDWNTTTSNVVGKVQGTEIPDKYLVISAHFDHLGRIGPDLYFPGANDNASGVALTLALADYFQNNPLKRSIVFIGFTGEEQGLKGSKQFVSNPPFPLKDISFLINLDMVASGTDGIVAVGGSDFESEFNLLSQVNDALQMGRLGKRPNAPNSDHFFFLQEGVRGFFLYTNKGDQPYHHPMDQKATLDWDDFLNTYELVRNFLTALDKAD